MSGHTDAWNAVESAIGCITSGIFDTDELITDLVIIVGAQHVDDEGDRCGRTLVIPRNGSQPTYVTKGLLTEALDLIRTAQQEV